MLRSCTNIASVPATGLLIKSLFYRALGFGGKKNSRNVISRMITHERHHLRRQSAFEKKSVLNVVQSVQKVGQKARLIGMLKGISHVAFQIKLKWL